MARTHRHSALLALVVASAAAACSSNAPPVARSGPPPICSALRALPEVEAAQRALLGDLTIVKQSAPFDDHRSAAALAKSTPGAALAEPMLMVEVTAVGDRAAADAIASGLTPATLEPLAPYVVAGSLDPLKRGERGAVALGKALASTLGVGVGDALDVLNAHEEGRIAGRVAALLEFPGSGITGIDDTCALLSLESAQALWPGDDAPVSAVVVRFAGGSDVAAGRAALEERLAGGWDVVEMGGLSQGTRRLAQVVEQRCGAARGGDR